MNYQTSLNIIINVAKLYVNVFIQIHGHNKLGLLIKLKDSWTGY